MVDLKHKSITILHVRNHAQTPITIPQYPDLGSL